MKLIEREYLKRIINVIGTPDIKVITGIKRRGKYCLLLQFMEYLKNEETDANIIYIDFNSIDSEVYLDYHNLHDYIESCYDMTKKIMFVLMKCRCAIILRKPLIAFIRV